MLKGNVYSPVALDQATVAKLEAAFSKRTGQPVSFCVVIDKALLGGLKVVLDGMSYDGTLRTQLLRVQSVLCGEGEA